MTGIDVTQAMLARAPFGVKEGRESRALRNLEEVAVNQRAGLLRRTALARQDPQHGVKVRHQDGRRNALPADVADGEDQPPVRERQNVVVIPTNASGWNTNAGECQARILRQLPREKRFLNFPGKSDFRVLARQFSAARPELRLDSVQRHPQDARRGGAAKRQPPGGELRALEQSPASIEQQPRQQ